MINFRELEELGNTYCESNFFQIDGNLVSLCFSNKKRITKKFMKEITEDFKNFESFEGFGEPYRVLCGFNEGESMWFMDCESDVNKYRFFWLVDIIYKKEEK